MRTPIPRALVALMLGLIVVAGCGPQQTADPASPGPATVAPTIAEPTAATTPALPTITQGPTATPFPLTAGWWDSAVCYEVFVRSFYDSNGDGIGDLNGLIEKLDYINDGRPDTGADLGANCIWLMPITEADSYHGYDTIDYYRVERDYGTNEDFKRLVAEAHRRGVKVLIDLVLNHTSSQSPWFLSAQRDPASPYRDWYIWSETKLTYRSPWNSEVWHRAAGGDHYYYGIFGPSLPDLNYRNPAVTAEAEKISAFWLGEMGVDGFRMDAIKHVIEDGNVQENTPETHAWLRQYHAALKQIKPDVFTVGEVFGGGGEVLRGYYPDQLDIYFAFDIGAGALDAANSGIAQPYLSAVASSNRDLPFQRWAPFLTNHDQDRVASVLGGNVGKEQVAAVALLTLPGLPFVYYGEEIGMTGSKPDPTIRTPMQWSDARRAGFTSGRPWQSAQTNYPKINVALQDRDPDSLLNLYRRLIHLHTTNRALATGSYTQLTADNPAVAAFVRQSGDERVLVLLNFGAQPATQVRLTLTRSDLPAGTYQLDPLLADQPGAPLTVGAGGIIEGATPLETLAPQRGYLFRAR